MKNNYEIKSTVYILTAICFSLLTTSCSTSQLAMKSGTDVRAPAGNSQKKQLNWNTGGSARLISIPSIEAAAKADVPEVADVVIVGAGLAGLTTAYKLKKDGVNAIVLEASPRIGGRVQSVYFPTGNYAEGHMEEYFQRSPAVDLLCELGFTFPAGSDKPCQVVSDPEKNLAYDVAHSSVSIDGTLYPYLGEGDRLDYLKGFLNENEIASLTAWNKETWKVYEELHKAFFDADKVPLDQPQFPKKLKDLQNVTFKDWVASFKLPHKVSEWIRITVEPEMSIEWDQISALDGIDEFRLFLDAEGKFGEFNYHVVGGNTHFTEALAGKLDPGQIASNAMVTAIDSTAKDGTKLVRYLRNGTTYHTIRAKAVVVTVPLYAIGNIQFIPDLSVNKRKAISTTGFAPYVKVHIMVDNKNGQADKFWHAKDGKNYLTLLSDSNAGSIYEATDFQRDEKTKEINFQYVNQRYGKDMSAMGNKDEVILTLLLHARFAKAMLAQAKTTDEKRKFAYDSFDKVFMQTNAGNQQSLGMGKPSQFFTGAEIFPYPTAVAYWPIGKERSRFDQLSVELRRPERGIYIGGDTTEDSHSEGAIRAALRMHKQLKQNGFR